MEQPPETPESETPKTPIESGKSFLGGIKESLREKYNRYTSFEAAMAGTLAATGGYVLYQAAELVQDPTITHAPITSKYDAIERVTKIAVAGMLAAGFGGIGFLAATRKPRNPDSESR